MAEKQNTNTDDEYTAPDEVGADLDDSQYYDDDEDESVSGLDTVTVEVSQEKEAISQPEASVADGNAPQSDTGATGTPAPPKKEPIHDLGDDEDRAQAAALAAQADRKKRNKKYAIWGLGLLLLLMAGLVLVSILGASKTQRRPVQTKVEQQRQTSGQNPAAVLAQGPAAEQQRSNSMDEGRVNPAAALNQSQTNSRSQDDTEEVHTPVQVRSPAVESRNEATPAVKEISQENLTPDERLVALIDTKADVKTPASPDMEKRLATLEADFAGLKSNIENVTAVLDRLAVGLQQQNADTSRITTAYNNAQSAIKGVNRLTDEIETLKASINSQVMQASMPEPLPVHESAGDYIVFSVVRDMAWVRHKSDDGKTYALHAGDKNTDFGEIYSVAQDQTGRWTVKTEVGTITEY